MEQFYFEKFQKQMAIKPNHVKEVEEYQTKHQIRLPKAYVEFISRGIDVSLWIWLGQTLIRCVFSDLDDIVEMSHECLQEVEADIGEFFPFAIAHADFFWFFRLNEGENPAVYYFDSAVYNAKVQEALVLEIPMEPTDADTGLSHGMTKLTDTFTDFVFAYANHNNFLSRIRFKPDPVLKLAGNLWINTNPLNMKSYFEANRKVGPIEEKFKKRMEDYQASHPVCLPAAYVEFIAGVVTSVINTFS